MRACMKSLKCQVDQFTSKKYVYTCMNIIMDNAPQKGTFEAKTDSDVVSSDQALKSPLVFFLLVSCLLVYMYLPVRRDFFFLRH